MADGTFVQTIKAVLWAFFGVRKGKDQDTDMARLNPVAVIITGVALAACFVGLLILVVNMVVK
jgi:hypothetical protein